MMKIKVIITFIDRHGINMVISAASILAGMISYTSTGSILVRNICLGVFFTSLSLSIIASVLDCFD